MPERSIGECGPATEGAIASTGVRWRATSPSAVRSPTRGAERSADQVRGVSGRVSKRSERRPGISLPEYGAAAVAFPARLATSGRAFWAASESIHSWRRSRLLMCPTRRLWAMQQRSVETIPLGLFGSSDSSMAGAPAYGAYATPGAIGIPASGLVRSAASPPRNTLGVASCQDEWHSSDHREKVTRWPKP